MNFMLEKQQLPAQGFKEFKKIVEAHSQQRPPFKILIFDSQKDVPVMNNFVLTTFFRHYSLYEFTFKPRRELILKTEPFLLQEFNAPLYNLEDMGF